MKKNILFLVGFISFLSFSQNEQKYALLIDSNNLLKHVSFLASDSMEGRNTGEAGQKKAAEYIQNEFRKLGLDSLTSNYYQPFFLVKKHKKGTLTIGNNILNFPEDFGFHEIYQGKKIKSYVGSIVSWENFEKSNFNSTQIVWVQVDSFEDIKWNVVEKKNPEVVFFLCNKYEKAHFTQYRQGGLTEVDVNKKKVFFINAKKLKANLSEGIPFSLDINSGNKLISTENVLGYIEGSDSILKKEFVVISAHYDHLGIKKGNIYNGADDNASGTSAVLELARVYQEAKIKGENPKRSVLFICFTGEEHGLLGSNYYCNYPLVPLKNTVADFNIDMIGRKRVIEKEKFYVYLIGSDKISLDFHYKQETVANKYGKLQLDYSYNDPKSPEQLYYRSDHYNFAKNGIPSIFYFGGFHKDYHTPDDDINQLNFSKIEAITRLVFYTSWYFAN